MVKEIENMNNNIEESYCSFEVSKLLKEKGFKVPTLCYYFEDGVFVKNSYRDTIGMDYGREFEIEYEELLGNWNDNFVTKKNGDRCFGCDKSKGYFETYSSPTHAIAIEWLRVNFDINIHDYHIAETDTWGADVYKLVHDYNKTGNGDHLLYSPILNNETLFKSPQEAIEEAIEASLLKVLKELI